MASTSGRDRGLSRTRRGAATAGTAALLALAALGAPAAAPVAAQEQQPREQEQQARERQQRELAEVLRRFQAQAMPLAGRAWLGISYRTEQDTTMSPPRSWLVVSQVHDASPASAAGVQAGDHIMRVDGKQATARLLTSISQSIAPGDTVRLRLQRAARERDAVVVAAPRPRPALGEAPALMQLRADSVRKLLRVFMDSAGLHLDSAGLPRLRILERTDSGFILRVDSLRSVPFLTDSARFRVWRGDTAALRRWRELGPPVPGRTVIRGSNVRMQGDTLRLNDATIVWSDSLRGTRIAFSPMGAGQRAVAGAEFHELDAELGRRFGVERGLLVLRVAPETPAARAGLQPWDVVVAARGAGIASVSQLRDALGSRAGNEPLSLEVIRDGRRRELSLRR
jgi:S1-C subfamily serine protease